MNTTQLLLGLLFSSIGFGYFIYGRKQSQLVTRYVGIGLMIYPYFIEQSYLIVLVGLVLMLIPRWLQI